MSIFKHLIITRFMCDNFIKKDTDVEINNKEWKEHSFDMAKRHIIPTLENQSNKDFILVFLVNDNTSLIDRIALDCLSDKINLISIRLSDFDNYIKVFNTDYLITSRLDYDDHIYKDCVNDIHNILDVNPDIKIWGLNSGITIVDGETDAYYQRREEYELNKEGFCAPMETLILKRDACKNGYFDIYKLGFHTEAVRNFINVQSHYMKKDDYTLEDIYCPKDYLGKDVDFIWTRHKKSASYLVFNITHTSNIKINISKEELKDKFGYYV